MKLSRQNVFHLFVICAFPVHVWAIIGYFEQAPAWLLRMDVLELAAMAGYQLLFALVESLIVFACVWLAAAILVRWLGEATVPAAALFVLLTSLASIWAQLDNGLFRSFWAIVIGIAYLALVVGGAWFARRNQTFSRGVMSVVERLAILSMLYFVFDAIGIVLVILRQFGDAN